MKRGIKRGVGFGVTSGIITTIGLIIGLYSSTASRMIILGGILSVAVADAFSDSLGIHVSEESSTKGKHNSIWRATFATFISKIVFAALLIIPILFFELQTAVIISTSIGLIALGIFSYKIAKERKDKPFKTVLEHTAIATFVIIVTYLIGRGISIL